MRETANRQREVPGGKWIFEDAPIPRAVAEMAVPTVITQLINIVYNFADTWYVGRTGNAAMVAALSVCMPIYVYMAAIANLFGIGGSSAISRSLGRKQTGRARHIFAFCLFGGLVAALLYALIMLAFGGRIIPLIGGDGVRALARALRAGGNVVVGLVGQLHHDLDVVRAGDQMLVVLNPALDAAGLGRHGVLPGQVDRGVFPIPDEVGHLPRPRRGSDLRFHVPERKRHLLLG